MNKQGPERGSSYPKVTQQMFLKIRKLYSLTASHPSTNPLPLLLEPWSLPWYYLVPMPYMSTILGEATASPRPPVGERGVAAALQGLCVEVILMHCCHVPQEQRAGRQAGRLCTLFMAGPPPRTVNRGAGSWHRGHLGSEGPR